MANVRANHRADPIRLHFTFLEDIFQGFLSTVCLFSCELKRGKGCLWRKTELVCVYFGNAIGGFWPFRSDFIALSFKCQALPLNQSGKDQKWILDIHPSDWVKKNILKTCRVPWKITFRCGDKGIWLDFNGTPFDRAIVAIVSLRLLYVNVLHCDWITWIGLVFANTDGHMLSWFWFWHELHDDLFLKPKNNAQT